MTRRSRAVARPLVAALAVMVAALHGCGPGADEKTGAEGPPEPGPRPAYYLVEVPDGAPVRGPRDALVTIVTFGDFQAPRAARNAESLAELVTRYPGKVRVVYRANPLPKHADAQRAELAVRAAARQGKFWELHDVLLATGKLGEAGLLAAAASVGCDTDRLLDQMAEPELAAEIARDRQAALELGLEDAPMSFVNGRPLEPVRFTDDAAAVIEEELRRAEELLRAGKPAAAIYAAVVDGGQRQLPGARRAARRVLDPEAVYRVPVLEDDPVRGPADALLTVVVFADFECPYSSRGAEALPPLMREFRGQIRVVFKHAPLPSHPNAALAAEAAVEAQVQGKFWEMHDALFGSFRELGRDKLLQIGESVGLDHSALEAAMSDRRHASRVERDRRLAAELGLHGTPHYFLNGKLVRGSRSFDQLAVLARQLIELAARAQRTLARNRPDGGADVPLYDLLTAEGATSPAYLVPGAPAANPDVVTDGKYRVYDVAVPEDAPSLGPARALVTVVEFGDYQCGWCRRAYPVLKGLRDRFGDRVRVVFMHFPIAGHEFARQAAEAAVEAQHQGKFWKFHEKLLESEGALSVDDLVLHAAEAGLDAGEMAEALESRRHRERVLLDARAGRALGLTGTPVFFVNGRKASATGFEKELPLLVEHVLARRGSEG